MTNNEVPALEQVISEMKISGATEEKKLLAVQQFFAGHFSYSSWLGPDKAARTNETALARFLLDSRSGHCEYFATATVCCCANSAFRRVTPWAMPSTNLPATATSCANATPTRGASLGTSETKTWKDFDTTPASWVAEENKNTSAMQWLGDFGSWISFQFEKLRWGQTNLRRYILWALVPVMALLLYQIIFRRGRKRRPKLKVAEFHSCNFLAGAGLRILPARTQAGIWTSAPRPENRGGGFPCIGLWPASASAPENDLIQTAKRHHGNSAHRMYRRKLACPQRSFAI